ncbi:hypothetical protein FOZ60_016011 [Perkinsus olseni]|uniref:Uncharacterized protein n=1 Tax=Perkinsus olseni TaxID=32597 RepID=A0A7J6P5T5_PEROL|nr:hypothetical protein FOZ60_016011 [Perkinsus olseni]
MGNKRGERRKRMIARQREDHEATRDKLQKLQTELSGNSNKIEYDIHPGQGSENFRAYQNLQPQTETYVQAVLVDDDVDEGSSFDAYERVAMLTADLECTLMRFDLTSKKLEKTRCELKDAEAQLIREKKELVQAKEVCDSERSQKERAIARMKQSEATVRDVEEKMQAELTQALNAHKSEIHVRQQAERDAEAQKKAARDAHEKALQSEGRIEALGEELHGLRREIEDLRQAKADLAQQTGMLDLKSAEVTAAQGELDTTKKELAEARRIHDTQNLQIEALSAHIAALKAAHEATLRIQDSIGESPESVNDQPSETEVDSLQPSSASTLTASLLVKPKARAAAKAAAKQKPRPKSRAGAKAKPGVSGVPIRDPPRLGGDLIDCRVELRRRLRPHRVASGRFKTSSVYLRSGLRNREYKLE